MGVRLAGIFAHPDDDIYLLGGTLLLGLGRVDLTLAFATSGEAGPISDTSIASRATLGEVRRGEQRRALELIGYGDASVQFLGHPDYYLPDVPLERLVGDVEAVLRTARPHIVVTFGPEGLTSHHDHVRVGEAATEAFHNVRKELGDSEVLSSLYYVALSRSDVDRFYEGVRGGGHDYGEEGRLFDITGVPDEGIAVRTDIRSVADRKLEAILAHKTQLIEWERIPEGLRWIYLNAECFVQAYPERPTGKPARYGLFEGLHPESDA